MIGQRNRPVWWPPDGPDKFYCTAGFDCDDGWFIAESERPGQAQTATRCRCLVDNIRAGKRGEGD